MPQLVGTNCAICRVRISNELYARFCRECGHPRHDACARTPEQPTETRCNACGAIVEPAAKSPLPKPKAASNWAWLIFFGIASLLVVPAAVALVGGIFQGEIPRRTLGLFVIMGSGAALILLGIWCFAKLGKGWARLTQSDKT